MRVHQSIYVTPVARLFPLSVFSARIHPFVYFSPNDDRDPFSNRLRNVLHGRTDYLSSIFVILGRFRFRLRSFPRFSLPIYLYASIGSNSVLPTSRPTFLPFLPLCFRVGKFEYLERRRTTTSRIKAAENPGVVNTRIVYARVIFK